MVDGTCNRRDPPPPEESPDEKRAAAVNLKGNGTGSPRPRG